MFPMTGRILEVSCKSLAELVPTVVLISSSRIGKYVTRSVFRLLIKINFKLVEWDLKTLKYVPQYVINALIGLMGYIIGRGLVVIDC